MFEAGLDFLTFFFCQEFGAEKYLVSTKTNIKHVGGHLRFGTIVDKELGEESNDNRDETFKNKDPSPTWSASDFVHFRNSTSKETTESTGKGSSREENGHSETTFVSSVPQSNVPCNTREKTTFSESKSHSDNEETFEILNETHCCHAWKKNLETGGTGGKHLLTDTPSNHDDT